MMFFKRLFSVFAMVGLAACGGGNGDTSPFGGDAGNGNGNGNGNGGTAAASDIALTPPSQTISNAGTGTVTVTATALDARGVALPNASLTLSIDNGGVLTIADNATVTNSSGQIVTTVGIGASNINRMLTVTARSGSVERTATVQVITTPGAATPAMIELLASSTTVGTGGDTITVQAFVKDATNNALPNTAITFATDTGTLSSVSATTNAAGVATASFAAGSNKANRQATITASSGTVQSMLTLQITGTKLVASGPTSLILGASGNYTIQVVDSKGSVLSSVTVTPNSTLGNAVTPATATTDANGQVQFSYLATNSGADSLAFSAAGFTTVPLTVTISGDDFVFVAPAPGATVAVGASQVLQVRLRQGGQPAPNRVIDFTATGGTLSASSASTDASGLAQVNLSGNSAGPVTVQATVRGSTATATLALSIVAVSPAKLILQVSPTAIAPNPVGSTANQARVVAKVTDAAGNPVQGVTVNFSRVSDPSGGNLLQPSAVTDVNGQASVPYSAGAESTANNGVILRGTVASSQGVFGDTALTVNQTALFISLGTGNTITNVDPQTYRKDYVVFVTDSNGVAVSGVTLTMKALPLHYLRGNLVLVDDLWVYANPIRVCRNEDANFNGILDPAEDDNTDGVLTPGNVVAVSPGNVQTDGNGRATVSLVYAESFAPWVNVRLTASATVTGTESRRDADFILPGLATDFTASGGPPAGVVSPFGFYAIVRSEPTICTDYPSLPPVP